MKKHWLPDKLPPWSLGLAIFGVLAGSYLITLFALGYALSATSLLALPLIALPLAATVQLTIVNRALNRQLDRMARIQTLSLPAPSRRQPHKLLEHFRALLNPEGWLLAEDGDLLHNQNMTLGGGPPLPDPGRGSNQRKRSGIGRPRA